MRKLIIPVVAIALAFSSSAFTAKKTNSVFYQYIGSSRTQTEIKKISNYVRAEAGVCEDGPDVCGVLLSTDTGAGHQPNSGEFTTEQNNLWSSQQNSAPADANILMLTE